MTTPSTTATTPARLICQGCNQSIGDNLSFAERIEALRVHDNECWSHGSTSFIDGQALKACGHSAACYRVEYSEETPTLAQT